jgi:hypothetical protein
MTARYPAWRSPSPAQPGLSYANSAQALTADFDGQADTFDKCWHRSQSSETFLK